MRNIHFRLKALFYLIILFATGPLVALVLSPFFIAATSLHFMGLNIYTRQQNSPCGKKTILITGAPHTKGLQVCRIMKSRGHHVILADVGNFKWSAARFSFAVDRWAELPDMATGDYVNGITSLIVREEVDWWIPVSHTNSALLDARAKQVLAQTHPRVKVLCLDSAETAATLDDNVSFLRECQRLHLLAPELYEIDSVDDLEELRTKGVFRDRHFFLKPLTAYSEDRLSFRRVPEDETAMRDFADSFRDKVSTATPYFVNEYIKGSEWTGNCVVSEGRIELFICNPSSPVQIDYEMGRRTTSDKVFEWVKSFCGTTRLTGCVCFDFIEEEDTGRLLCIECNPRLHSNIVLTKNALTEAAMAFERALEPSVDAELPTTPPSTQNRVIWIYNELGKCAGLASPAFLGEALRALRAVVHHEDAVLDLHDPFPFFFLAHLQMPALLWIQIRNGNEWSILNFCLGQIR